MNVSAYGLWTFLSILCSSPSISKIYNYASCNLSVWLFQNAIALKYELQKLSFNNTYTVQLKTTNEDFGVFSDAAEFKLHTLKDCLNATQFSYNLCGK